MCIALFLRLKNPNDAYFAILATQTGQITVKIYANLLPRVFNRDVTPIGERSKHERRKDL